MVAVVGVLLVVATFATACNPGQEEPPREPETTSASVAGGGKVTYGLEADNPGGWCLPEAQLAIAGYQVARGVYDTLTVPDSKAEYQPYLAESVTPNADSTQWIIKVRPNVKFHDGTALDANVVKNNIDAWRGKYPARKPLLFFFVYQDVADVQVVDPMTVQVTTSVPWPSFPAFLFLSGRAGIMGQKQLDSADCATELIGTGPFKQDTKDWKTGEEYRMVRNAAYWQTDASGTKLPYLDEITFVPYPDGDARVNALLSGQLQAMHTSGAEQIQTLTDEQDAGGVGLVGSDRFAEVAFGQLNSSKLPFSNKNARLALAYGLDRPTFNMVRNLDLFTMASGPFGKGEIGYLKDAGFPEYNVEKAKEYAAKYQEETGQPLSFTLIATPDPSTVKSAEFVQQQAKEAGVDVKLKTLEQSQLISTAIGGDFEAMVFRNYPGGEPDTNYVWWKGDSPVNFSRFKDAEIDRLLDQGRQTADKSQRQTIYQDINKRLGSEAYSIWLNWTQWDIGTDPKLVGVFGPNLPDASGKAGTDKPFEGLATGHPLQGLHFQK